MRIAGEYGWIESLIPANLRAGLVVEHPEHGNLFVRTTANETGVVDLYACTEDGREVNGVVTYLALVSHRKDAVKFLTECIRSLTWRLERPRVWCAEWCEMDSWRYAR